jgi:aspartate aminotransferase
MDFSKEQWAIVAEALERGGIVPLLDIAYQGLGDGLEADAAPVRMLAERLPEVLIAASCSKNFGLYRERAGCVILVAADGRAAGNAFAHMQILARKLYSMPPDHGAAIVATLAADPALLADWRAELEEMRIRVKGLRSMLASALRASFGDGRYDYVEAQRGMFSLLGGLTPAAIDRLAGEHHVYMPRDGRINIAGLPERSVERVAAAIRAVAD